MAFTNNTHISWLQLPNWQLSISFNNTFICHFNILVHQWGDNNDTCSVLWWELYPWRLYNYDQSIHHHNISVNIIKLYTNPHIFLHSISGNKHDTAPIWSGYKNFVTSIILMKLYTYSHSVIWVTPGHNIQHSVFR